MRISKSVVSALSVAAVLAVAPAMAANNPNFGQMISTIQAAKTAPSQIQSLTTVKSVNVVKAADLAKGENMKALDEAVTKNETDINSLRSAINANNTVKMALTNAQVDVTKVVAAEIASDGILTVYVR